MVEKRGPDKDKTIDDVLNQTYMSAYDLQIIMPTLTYANALKYIKKAREVMKQKNLIVPIGQTKVALVKVVRDQFGF